MLEATCLRLGVQIDIILDDDAFLLDTPACYWEQLGAECSALGLVPSVHLPFHGLNIGSHSRVIRTDSLRILSAGLAAAYMMRARMAVMHTGFLPMAPAIKCAEWIAHFAYGYARLLHRATQCGVSLLLENTWEPDPTVFDKIEAAVGQELGYCLDIGHTRVFSKGPAEEWVKRFGVQLRAIHLHDNFGVEDSHLPLGEGNTDFSLLRIAVGVPASPPRLIVELKPRYILHSLQVIRAALGSNPA
ncbi:MAG: sugar phosphate isomerase/epimerase family protein [Candidatus Brocadiia bacterium]